ncbi:MAG TPA: isocitrate lyase/phosphoenolpyruvate mutase family protein [Chitinophagaceae bacterium]|nr:isocitrate lyase/phosphoenolpyruvate mutase family protein [Chitinophagaceae bacterium]
MQIFRCQLEGGFSRNIDKIIENIERLHDTGVVGINIEDSLKGNDGIKIQPANVLQQIISAVTNHFEKKNIKMFINARTDGFVVKIPGALQETITRAKLYGDAGANGIFVPFLQEKGDIAAVVASTRLPVNVFALPALPGFSELAALGVKRISMGTSVYNAAKRFLNHTINTIVSEQSFSSLY